MAPRQHDGIPLVCGRDGCGRTLCRALLAEGKDPPVVLVNVRQPALWAPAEAGPGPVRRVRLTCHRSGRCPKEYRLRLDHGRLVELMRDPGGRRRLVLGVDL